MDVKYNIIFIAHDDWCNVGTEWALACQSIGMKSLAICWQRAMWHYIHGSVQIHDNDELQRISDGADVVVHMHTHIAPIKRVPGQKWIVFHGGSRFRRDPATHISTQNPLVDMTWIQTGELFGFGCKNEHWMMPAIDTEYLQPHFSDPRRISEDGLRFAHYPRVAGNGIVKKGTKGIVKIACDVERLRENFRWSYGLEPKLWVENMERMSQPDIYIERLSRSCKEWGITAMEAAALGKVVITQFESKERYEREFECECPFVISNTPEELKEKIMWLLDIPPEEIIEIQKRTRDWVCKVHGYEPTARRIQKHLEELNENNSNLAMV